jgi:hypothetical protein
MYSTVQVYYGDDFYDHDHRPMEYSRSTVTAEEVESIVSATKDQMTSFIKAKRIAWCVCIVVNFDPNGITSYEAFRMTSPLKQRIVLNAEAMPDSKVIKTDWLKWDLPPPMPDLEEMEE